MKIEKLKTNKITSKGVILGLVIGVSLIIVINLLFSYSKYKAEDNVDLAEGTINYVIPDLKLMAVYVKNEKGTFEKKDTVPSDTIYQVVKDNTENSSYCVDQLTGDRLDNVYMKYQDGNILINVNKKGTKCWVYLEKATLLNKDILAKNTPKESTYNATYKNIAEFTGISTTDEGIYSMIDYDGEPTYYFRGAVTDNYVHFAGFYWRIIRINSDGSIRMIYDGTSAHANGVAGGDGKNRQTGTSAYNTSENDAKYVGFMFGGKKDVISKSYVEAHKNETNSDILASLESWYKKNLEKYENYLDKDAIFCNDRRSLDNFIDLWPVYLAGGSVNKNGFGNQQLTAYGPRARAWSDNGQWQATQYVDLSCQPNDRFTPADATRGNKVMNYPIGLITFDEAIMAGGFGGKSNNQNYLYTGQAYWTMSPDHFGAGVHYATIMPVYSGGNFGGARVSSVYGVRPVINLKANTTFSKGNGSINLPYEII